MTTVKKKTRVCRWDGCNRQCVSGLLSVNLCSSCHCDTRQVTKIFRHGGNRKHDIIASHKNLTQVIHIRVFGHEACTIRTSNAISID